MHPPGMIVAAAECVILRSQQAGQCSGHGAEVGLDFLPWRFAIVDYGGNLWLLMAGDC